MATFEARVNGLTQLGATLSGSTVPTESQLDEFLKDGVNDVTQRCITINPAMVQKFLKVSSTQASNGYDAGTAQVVKVIREAGADGDTDGSTAWEICSKGDIGLQSRYVDENSMNYASKHHPKFIIDESGKVNVYPVPDGTDDGYRVYIVNNNPVNGSGSTLLHSHDDIKYFPTDKIYLVVIYASMKSIQAKLSSLTLPSLKMLATAPEAPLLTSLSAGSVSAGSASWLTSSAPGTDTTGYLNTTTTEDGDPSYSEVNSNLSSGIVLSDLDTAHSDEDPELIQAAATGINSEVGLMQAQMQDNLNKFNSEIQNVQLQVQETLSNLQGELQASITNAQQTTSVNVKKAELDLQAAIKKDELSLQKYGSELQQYQAEVAEEVQVYTQKIQYYNTDYQWYLDKYQRLSTEYNEAFQLMAGVSAQKDQAKRSAR